MDSGILDCIIIGGGPAGLTAGIYLRRFRRSILILDSGASRARRIPLSNNYPGFPQGINGEQLLRLLRQQLERFDGVTTAGTVTALRTLSGQLFSVELADRTLTAKTILLATGVVDIEPDLPGYQDIKDAIRFCPICDGFEFTNQRIGIIGTGWHGVRECEFIKNFSSRLSFICLEKRLEQILQVRQHLRDTNIEVLAASDSRLYGRGSADGCIYLETADGKSHEFDVIYCALGYQVRSGLAIDLGAACDEQACLVVSKHLETSIPGLYAAGDVVSGLDQLAVAAGQAAIAATAIHNRLRGE